MERRLAVTYIVAATTTFGVACITIAIASGGLFASAAAPTPAGTKRVEIIDDYIVIHSSTTTTATPVDPAIVPIDTAPAPAARSQIARASAPAAAPAPTAGQPAVPQAAANDVPIPEQQEPSAPTEPSPTAAPAVTSAPAVAAAPSQSPPTPVPPTAAPPATEPPAPAPTPTAPPTTVSAARPPIPEGCREPRFRNGTWKCDDD